MSHSVVNRAMNLFSCPGRAVEQVLGLVLLIVCRPESGKTVHRIFWQIDTAFALQMGKS